MYKLVIKTSESGKSKYFGFMLDGEFVKCASKKSALILISKFNSLNGEINDLSSQLSKQSEQSSSSKNQGSLDSATSGDKLRAGDSLGQPDPEAEKFLKSLRDYEARRAAADARRAEYDAKRDAQLEEQLGIISELSDLSELKLKRLGSQAGIYGSSNRARYQLDPETVDVAYQSIS